MNLFKRREPSNTNSVIRQFGNSVISPNSVIRQFGNSVISPNSVIRQFGNSVISPDLVIGKARQAFTLIELLVVISMIAVILGAMTVSVSSARERALIQKATSDVKVISQAILSYENWSRNGQLETMNRRDADSGSLGFLLGNEQAQTGGKIPVLLMAQLRGGGKMLDPWGTPYKVTIKQGSVSAAQQIQLRTGYHLQNFYRLGPEERQ